MRHMTSKAKAQVEAEVAARRQAAIAAVSRNREALECEHCEREEHGGYIRVWPCSKHEAIRG